MKYSLCTNMSALTIDQLINVHTNTTLDFFYNGLYKVHKSTIQRYDFKDLVPLHKLACS